MNLGKDILKEIKKDKIEPKAKWIFVLKNIVTWSLGILSLIISSLTVSVIIHIINNNDYLFFRMVHPSPISLIIRTLPYFWIIAMIIFVIIFRYTLKQTKRGYKIKLYKIIIISIVLSITLGTLFYSLGIGNNIDDSFSRKSPFYNKMMAPRRMMWLQEDQGIIAGRIISVQDDNNFDLEDFNKKLWHIIKIREEIPRPQFRNLPPREIILELDLEIRAYGEKIDENTFRALIIRPMNSRGSLRIK